MEVLIGPTAQQLPAQLTGASCCGSRVYHTLFPRGVRDNAAEVNEHLHAVPTRFCEAVEEGVR